MSKKIFFIHGLNGNKKTWHRLISLISKDTSLEEFELIEYTYPTLLFNFCPWLILPKIQTIADGLKTEINNKTEIKDEVVLIAHSMGGLIVRKYLVEEIKNKRDINVRKIICYATPNLGSELAKLSWLTRVTHIAQMKKNSDFLTELKNDWKVLQIKNYIRMKYVVAGRDKYVDANGAKNEPNQEDVEVLINKSHNNVIKPDNEGDIGYLLLKKFLLSKNRYLLQEFIKPENYINRNIVKVEDYYKSSHFFTQEDIQKKLEDAILQEKKIVLLAGAGEGKTKETDHLCWNILESEKHIYPVKVRLKNYFGGNITSIFPTAWEKIPKNQLLLILDGLDEIESKNFRDVTKSIESFLENNPDAKCLVTCRTNIYQTPSDNFTGTINSFQTYYLTKLSYVNIEVFINENLGTRSKSFLEKVNEKKLHELLYIPFYLVYLMDYYNENNSVPNNVCEFFDELVNKKIALDLEHYRNTFDITPAEMLRLCERVAIASEILGRNQITNSEIESFVKADKNYELLKHSGLLLKRVNETKIIWEFEHNNFQEFLAAKVLSRNNLDTIKQFIAFGPDHNKVIPSWTNTLSFLSTLYPKDDLLNWLYESQPELLVKFERDRISPALRHEIFIKIFNYYKQRKIWIDNEKYDLFDLGKIASDEQSVDFLIKEVETDQDSIIRANAIMMFGFVENLEFEKIEKIKNLILELISEHKAEILVTKSINALNNLSFHDIETVHQIIKNLDEYSNAHTRACIYNIIQESRTANDFVDILLNGIQYTRTSYKGDDDMTLVDEGYYLAKALEQITSEQSVIKILEYFIKNPKDLSEVSLRDIAKIFSKNVATLIKSEETMVFDLALEFLVALGKEYILEYTKEFFNCFNESGTTLKAFINIFARDYDAGIKYTVLSLLADKECIDYMVAQFILGKVTNNDISSLRNFLMSNQPELSKHMDQRLEKETAFEFPKKIDYEAQRISQRKRDLEMVFDKNNFFKEIKMVFEKEKKVIFTKEEVRALVRKNWKNSLYANKALRIIREEVQNQKPSLDEITNRYTNVDFDYWFVKEVYDLIVHNDDFEIEERYKKKIHEWCLKYIDGIKFRTAITMSPGRQFHTSTVAILTWFFMQKFDFQYSEEIMLDMLSFDWHGIGIDYLTKKIDINKIIKRIINNLESNDENEIAIQNYFAFGINQKVKELLPYARNYLGFQVLDISCRKIILEYVLEFDEKDEAIEIALKQTQDDFKWQLVEKLFVRKNRNIEKYLISILMNGSDEDKTMASQYLIELQNLKGLIYFVEKIKKEMSYMPRWYNNRNSLRTLTIKGATPFLLEILELTYIKEFRQTKFDKLESKIFDSFTNISIQSEENYFYIKKELEKFIKEKEYFNDNIRFINSFLERLERTFYFNKSQNITLEEVLHKLKLLVN